MKSIIVVTLGVFLFTACAGQSNKGSSPTVPKPVIEKAADTKIPDAGDDGGK
jgi:hypothetical protein